MEKISIGISIGDVNGIGLEVILKTFSDERMLDLCTPIIYGSSKVVSYHRNIVQLNDMNINSIRSVEQAKDGVLNVVNCWQENVNINLGQITPESGKYALRSLEVACHDLKNDLIDALVTAPINKKAMEQVDFPFPGHTEYLASKFDSNKENLMFMINDRLRVATVTNHVSIANVAPLITTKKVLTKLNILYHSLRKDFGIDKPRIAVLGLNPHAGDNGYLGSEDQEIILPAIKYVQEKGLIALGPFSADGFFGAGKYKEYDAILAMYHDQGLIPFKLLSFGDGVNFTAGLNIVRTSPDHGTAYEIAGKNKADISSFRKAIFNAIDIVTNRNAFAERHANPLEKKVKLKADTEKDEPLEKAPAKD